MSKGEATIKRGSQETFKVIVTDDTTAYFYIWRPDSSIDQEYTVTWEYSNTGTVINLPNPKNVAGNTKFDVSNIKLFPKSYPVITKAGKSYVYDEDGGEGTYTVNWSYIIRSDGYNIGTDAYKIGPCYHVDGYAVLVEETNCTVSFDVQEVGDENFRPVESYPIIIKKNTNIKDLNVPVVADKTVDGDQYKFDGWYKDKECTVKASFTEGRITENTTFYGRYVQVLKPGQLAYDANGGIGVMTPTKGSVNKNVTVASNTFTRAGYSFSGWNTEREGTGTYYAPGSQYKLLAGDNILYAQWTPDKNTKYSVAYYYQNSDNGKFVEDTKLRDDTRTGVTGTLVEIAEDDKVAEKAGYILDNSQIKNWQGTISGDGKLVLKVYFKLQYTIAIAGDDHVNITSDSPIYVDWGSNATGSWTIDEGYSISEVTVNRVPVKVASDATSYTMSNIKENIDVYVKTKSEDANYKIEYYQENLPGAEARYTKVKEGSGKGKTGERVQINAENFDGFEYQKDKDEYFVGKTPQSQSSPIIAGDGSLVIKLYYDRKTNLSVEVKYVEYVSDDADYSTAEELIKSEKLTGTFGTVYDIPEKSIQDYDLKLIIDRNNPKVFNENMDTIYVTYTKRAAYTVWFNGIQITDLINDQNQNNYQTSDDEWITKLSWNGMASNNTSVPYSENEIKDLADQMLKIYSDNTGWDNLSYKSFDIVQEIDLPNGKKDWETLYTSGGHESLKNVKLRAGYETRYQIYFDSTMSIKATGANRIYNGELQNLIESLTTQIDGSGAEITPTYTYEIAKITNNVIGNYKASKNPTEIEAGEYSIRIKAKKDKFKDTETVIRAVISKRPITVYAGSLTEKYDGSEKEVTKFTYTVSNEDNTAGALEDHTVSAVLENNKRTEAGDQVVRVVENSVRILSGETNVTGNYVVSLETGLLIISRRDDLKITVDAESLSHVYDGAGHGIKAAEASDTKGTTIEYSTNGRTWSGTIPQFTDYKEGGYPVYVRAKNLNYSNTAEAEVVFNITKRPVTVSAGTETFTYDGSEKKVTEIKAEPVNETNTEGILPDHTAKAELENNKRTDAGEQIVKIKEGSVTILSGRKDVTENYAVSLGDGKLIINQKGGLRVTVDAENLSHVYDGAGHGIKAAEASDAKGTTIEYSTDGESWSGTIPQFTEYQEGGYPVYVRAKNDNYSNVAEADVVFRITKRPIKVAAGILETEYDGSEKAVTEFTYTVSNKENTAGALKDHKVSAVLKNNTRTEAGEQTVSVEENSVRILSGEADVTKNYAVSLEDGKLTVNQKDGLKVTVDAESLSHVYDGAGHGIKAAEASDAKGTTIEYSTDGESWSGTIPQFTEYQEGGYPVYVRAKNDNYSNVAEADVVFRITKRPIKVAAGILETEYDGSEKAVTEFTYTVSNKENTAGALKDHKVSAVLKNNTRTEAGEQTVSVEENSVRILSGEADVTKNYAVSLEDGKLTVNQKDGLKVTVDAESLSHVYDGAGHGIKAAEASDAKGTTIEYSTDGESWSGTIPQFTEYQEGGYPVYVRATNDNYSNAATAEVVFNITKRPVTVSAGIMTAEYDGSEKEVTEIRYTEADSENAEGVLAGHTVTAKLLNNKRTDAGEQAVSIEGGSVRILSGRTDVTKNYAVSLGDGKLTISQKGDLKVTVDAESLSHVYDGAGHGIKAAEASDAKGTTIEYSTDGESWSGTIPQFTEYQEGGYPVYVRAKNDNYSNVAEADVVFRITKRPIKVAAGILETEYDGSEKAVTEFTYTVSNKENTAGALKDHKVSAVLKNNTRTEAGEQTVSVEENSVRILSGEADVTKNYAVSLEDGKLTVNQKDGLKVTVDAESLSHVYDGAGHGIKAAEASDAKGTTIEYSTDGESWSGTIPQFTEYQEGGYPVYVRAKNDNYSNVAEADVVFRITKRPIKVAAGILETEYDGSEKAVTEFTYTVSNKENTAGALKDHKVSAVLKNNTRTEAGEQTVSVEENSVRILSGEADVTKNYAVSLEDGKLTVNQKDGLKVTVDAESLSHVYDGAGHGIKAAEASDAKGTTIEYSTDGESWSGTIPQFTEYQEDGYPVYVRATNPNYSNTAMADVIFMITQRPAHIQASNDGKVFGTADPELMASVTGIVTGEKLNYNLNRVAGEDVGTYPIEVILGSNPNYSITYDNAVFEITSADTNKVFITGTTATYDGKAYGVDASVVQNGSTILYSTNQTDWSETAPTFTEAGTYTVYVKATNPNYNETQVAEGTVVISKREVTITADSAEKRYDGTDLTAPTATITGGTLVEGQTLESVTVTGAQRSTGTSANVASNAMIKSGNTDVTANYAITYTDGVLTVTSVGGNSGGNPGGNGGGSTPNENKPYQPGGPGDNNGPTVTIDPDAVPLANAPVDGSPTDNLILIDDGNVPLAGLPKTGDRAGAQAGLAAILSGFLLAAFSMLNNKKKEENK